MAMFVDLQMSVVCVLFSYFFFWDLEMSACVFLYTGLLAAASAVEI